MNILVTGATGFLGKYVVRSLLDAGHHVRAVVRPGRDVSSLNWPTSVEIFHADLAGEDDLVPGLEGIDAVIHLATPVFDDPIRMEKSGVDGTKRLLEAMVAANCKRLVHASSISVYDWLNVGKTLNEQSPVDLHLNYTTYSRVKCLQESMINQAALEYGLKTTILRPAVIWGRDRLDMFFVGGHKPLWLIFGPNGNVKDTYVENCADAFVLSLDDKAIGHIFNVVDGSNTTRAQYARAVARRCGKSAIRLPIPHIIGYCAAHLLTGLNKLAGGRLPVPGFLSTYNYNIRFGPVQCSADHLRKTLGWTPRYSFEESMNLAFSSETHQNMHPHAEAAA